MRNWSNLWPRGQKSSNCGCLMARVCLLVCGETCDLSYLCRTDAQTASTLTGSGLVAVLVSYAERKNGRRTVCGMVNVRAEY